ncbi:MAG: metal-sensitive transcriptional regulator [Actinomycetota bacterium]|nr:metal-sensitive transcriptional regulator [Actinomycetota bacterium]
MSSTVSLPELKPGPDSGRRRTVNRLKRARGQLTALIAAVESGAERRNVVNQLSAVHGALDTAGFELISTAMRDCLTEPADVLAAGGVQSELSGQKPALEEIRTLFLRLT